MKDVFRNLVDQLKSANGPTRVVIAAGFALMLAVAGVATYRASNPHMTLLRSNLDAAELSSVSAAVANAGIRFETSHPPGPFSVWVEKSRLYEATNAIYLEGALDSDPRGITTAAGGASSVFLASGEREQQMQKRKWQEVEKQLEVYSWIAKATVTSSSPPRTPLRTAKPPTVSVVLQLRGMIEPDREQRDTVATIVRSAFGVPTENVVISDQYGRPIHDGSRDKHMDEVLDFQRQFDDSMTADVQAILDETYGPGMATAAVHSEWSYERVESVDESLDPQSKVPISKSIVDSSTPQGTGTMGGPAGTASNLSDDPGFQPDAGEAAGPVATNSETQERYLVGRKTTHTLQNTPLLERMTVTLLLDESLSEELSKAEQWVKGVVGFDDTRGDLFTAASARFSGLERDADGNPVEAEPEPLPEPASATTRLLIERGVEILAALAFVFVLLRSLRAGRVQAAPEESVETAETITDEEIDVEMLARRHVEQLLENDPEKVSALLSRWALSETVRMGGK